MNFLKQSNFIKDHGYDSIFYQIFYKNHVLPGLSNLGNLSIIIKIIMNKIIKK